MTDTQQVIDNLNAKYGPKQSEQEAADTTPDAPAETPAEAAAKDAFHVIPNREMKRAMITRRGQVKPMRSRIRRRIFRIRRYYESK